MYSIRFITFQLLLLVVQNAIVGMFLIHFDSIIIDPEVCSGQM